MDDLVDLHTHILPGLDDGPDSIRESAKMVEALQEIGFRHIFATPHHRLYTWEGLRLESISAGIAELEEALSGKGLKISLYPGIEYDLDESLAERAQIRPPGARHILVDIGFWGVPDDLMGLLNKVRELDVEILLVHPERNGDLCRNPELVKSLVRSGIRFTGNLGSLSGLYGREIRKDCCSILQEGFYWAMASDLHSLKQASWVRKGLKELEKTAGQLMTRELLFNNPVRILKAMMEGRL
jgi:protein-tyrosine phosphatase